MEKILKTQTVTPQNILRWYSPLSQKTESRILSLNSLENCLSYCPAFIPGEDYSCFLNLQTDFGLTPETVFSLRLNDLGGNLLEKFSIYTCLLVEGQIYLSFKFLGEYNGAGKISLCDESMNPIFESQICLFGEKFLNHTNYFEFYHDRDLNSIPYAHIFSTYGIQIKSSLRLPITLIGVEYEQEIKQYRNATNRSLRNVNFDTDKIYKLKSNQSQEEDCEALALSMIPCSTIYINGIGVSVKSALKTTKKDKADLYSAEFDVYKNGRSSDFSPPIGDSFSIIECSLESIDIIEQVL